VGYKVFVLPDVLLIKPETAIELYTYQYVRETSIELYGFLTEQELSMFEILISVSGVGPKTAITILGLTSVDQLKAAVASGDIRILTKVSGIGRKTAERLLLELRDTFQAEARANGTVGAIPASDVEVIEALERLGYSTIDSRRAIELLPEDLTGTEQRLKAALKSLGGNK